MKNSTASQKNTDTKNKLSEPEGQVNAFALSETTNIIQDIFKNNSENLSLLASIYELITSITDPQNSKIDIQSKIMEIHFLPILLKISSQLIQFKSTIAEHQKLHNFFLLMLSEGSVTSDNIIINLQSTVGNLNKEWSSHNNIYISFIDTTKVSHLFSPNTKKIINNCKNILDEAKVVLSEMQRHSCAILGERVINANDKKFLSSSLTALNKKIEINLKDISVMTDLNMLCMMKELCTLELSVIEKSDVGNFLDRTKRANEKSHNTIKKMLDCIEQSIENAERKKRRIN